ncbi:cell wall-binding repeat-containing protein [Embleya sp. NPDC008237]|uniref:cell wall-binding repeat-containing protein n=1 Tax=Embleya sp. NPDC008237 TaxID=3363978 RepID=UPI0036E14BC0
MHVHARYKARAAASVAATVMLAAGIGVGIAPSAHAAPGDPVDAVYVTDRADLSDRHGVTHLVQPQTGQILASFGVLGIHMTDASPDGRRVVGSVIDGTQSPRTVRSMGLDGSAPIEFTPADGAYGRAAFSPDGTKIYMNLTPTADGGHSSIVVGPSDGGTPPRPLFPGPEGTCDRDLSFSAVGLHAFTRADLMPDGTCSMWRHAMLWDERTGTVERAPKTLEARDDDVANLAISPDGTTLALTNLAGGYVCTFDLAARTWKDVYKGGISGPISRLRWSADGTKFLYDVSYWTYRDTFTADAKTGVQTVVRAHSTDSVFKPGKVTPSVGVRVYGSNAITTGVATSRFKFDAAGSASGARKANVAVLTRSDAFYDGLAGAGLAGAKGGPMLLTPKEGLAPAVSAELARILSPGATVYVLGDEGVVSAAVDTQIRALGLTPKRLAGNTVAETGVAIANELTSAPKEVFVATAAEYYDALAAGATAGSTPDATVVFSWGNTLPAASASYLSGLDRTKTKVTAVGGPAVAALGSASIRIDATADGRTAPDTAKLLAEHAFTHPKAAALTTMATWQDALTGGALIAGKGPLLLATQTTLPQGSANYLTAEADSLDRVVVVGGSDVLDNAVAGQAASLTGPYGLYDFVDSPNGDVKVSLG